MGILNRVCAVVPPSSKMAAIPDDATEGAILPSDRTLASVKLITNEKSLKAGVWELDLLTENVKAENT
jgi:hypothetical protein